ncbi:MAG: response regulator [Elusimicrobiaceae bacterium]|jgi:DNA-binding response OmpR family regulator
MSKILIIEDDNDIALLLGKRLIKSKFEVMIASDAYLGTKNARETKPDLIILDLMMPAGGGMTVLKNLKLSINTKLIPVIVFTGMRNDDIKAKVLDMGVDAYIEKPYDFESLLNLIDKLIFHSDDK